MKKRSDDSGFPDAPVKVDVVRGAKNGRATAARRGWADFSLKQVRKLGFNAAFEGWRGAAKSRRTPGTLERRFGAAFGGRENSWRRWKRLAVLRERGKSRAQSFVGARFDGFSDIQTSASRRGELGRPSRKERQTGKLAKTPSSRNGSATVGAKKRSASLETFGGLARTREKSSAALRRG